MADSRPVVINMEQSQQAEPVRQAVESPAEYIDILLLGKTGMGKSTTVDKLMKANPYRKNYVGAPHSPTLELQDSLQIGDITVWTFQGKKIRKTESSRGKKTKETDDVLCDERKAKEMAEARVKRIVFQRSVSEDVSPTEYDSPDSLTENFELLANETSRIRVLDIPGFSGSTFFQLPHQDDNMIGAARQEASVCNLHQQNLEVMRKILRIQAEKSLAFHRILYFLPFRGPPERADAILQSELSLMEYFFGRAIFDCMIIVATHYEDFSRKGAFTQRHMTKTRAVVNRAMELAFSQSEHQREGFQIPQPPIVYISVEENGTEIYNKLLQTKVIQPKSKGLQLTFQENTCARCAMKFGIYKDDRLVCFEEENGIRKVIPYSESKCHPLIKPKYSRLEKIIGGIAYIVLLGIPHLVGATWPWFSNIDEVCAGCKQPPGSPGCLKVEQETVLAGTVVKVDHKSELDQIQDIVQ